QIAFLQHPRIMSLSDPGPAEMDDNTIWRHDRLEFESMDTLVAVIDLSLLLLRSTYWPDGAVDESPASTKRGLFLSDSVSKESKIFWSQAPFIKLEKMSMIAEQNGRELIHNSREFVWLPSKHHSNVAMAVGIREATQEHAEGLHSSGAKPVFRNENGWDSKRIHQPRDVVLPEALWKGKGVSYVQLKQI